MSSWNVSASLALLYLILYCVLFLILIYLYATRAIALRSRYTVISFHILIRLASQATGLAFSLVGYANVNLLVAYFILGAEGYFTLVLCAYRFLVAWHYAHLESGDSWLEPKRPQGEPFFKRMLDGLLVIPGPGRKPRPMSLIHNLLIVANALIISGGSILSGGNDTTATFGSDKDKVNTAKILRSVGQAMFLAINIFLLFVLLHTVRQSRREQRSSRRSAALHPTLMLLLLAWPLLLVRGLYGLLYSFVNQFNYFYAGNYTDTGLTHSFIVYEYVLGTTMEWASCALLIATYWAEKYWPGNNDGEGGYAVRDKESADGTPMQNQSSGRR